MKKNSDGGGGKQFKKVTKDVGVFILEMLINIPFSLTHAFLDQKGLRERIRLEGFSIDRYNDRLKDLQKRGYIKINNESIEITKKGRIHHLEKSNSKEMDGKWRILSWDIPESMSLQRNQFRRSIKRIGYRQVQKSLWVCPLVKADEVDLIIDEYGVRKHVAYFIVEKTDIDSHLHKLFKTP
jgi:CRISPR/Cas system-associated endoribonuclease Cas2